MEIQLDPSARHVLLARHLQQEKKPNQRASDWFPEAHLNRAVAEPVAARLRAEYLEGLTISLGGFSSLRRTMETLRLLAAPLNVAELWGLTPDGYQDPDGMWQFCERMRGDSAKECFEFEPALMKTQGAKVFATVQTVASRLEVGEVALLVSHGPLCECGIAAAFNHWPPKYSFNKGDMGLFRFYDDESYDFVYLPVPA